jgi:hypothetical protein
VPALSPSSGSAGARLLAATPELSLAWKLKWLVGDLHPQGKDLYDAVLLAEHCALSYELLGAAFIATDRGESGAPTGRADIAALAEGMSYEWRHFTAEYPWLPGDLDMLVDRLLSALTPTFAGLPAHGEPEYPLRARWVASRIRAARELLEATDLATVLGHLAADPLSPGVDVVVVRELLGPDSCDVATARDVLYTDPAWAEHLQSHPQYSRWAQEGLDRL